MHRCSAGYCAKVLPRKTQASAKAPQSGPSCSVYRPSGQCARSGRGACSEHVPGKDGAQLGLPTETWARLPADISVVIPRKAAIPQWAAVQRQWCRVKGWARSRHISRACGEAGGQKCKVRQRCTVLVQHKGGRQRGCVQKLRKSTGPMQRNAHRNNAV